MEGKVLISPHRPAPFNPAAPLRASSSRQEVSADEIFVIRQIISKHIYFIPLPFHFTSLLCVQHLEKGHDLSIPTIIYENATYISLK